MEELLNWMEYIEDMRQANRALLPATPAEETSTLRGALFSDDSSHFLKCIRDLWFDTQVQEDNRTVSITGQGGPVPLSEASQYVGSAGTAARFLTAYLGLSRGTCHMDAPADAQASYGAAAGLPDGTWLRGHLRRGVCQKELSLYAAWPRLPKEQHLRQY